MVDTGMAEPRSRRRTREQRMLRGWLVADTVLVGLGAVLWLAASAIALTAFGAPGTSVTVRAWAFVLTLWSYPIWGLAPLVASWMIQRRSVRLAFRISLLPLFIAVAAGIAFWH
jgi:hypothetical protein